MGTKQLAGGYPASLAACQGGVEIQGREMKESDNAGGRDSMPNLYLVGFMGVGKSVIGRRLASLLKFRFLDSDQEIEALAGKSIGEIFASEGEDAFRRMERSFIESGHPSGGCVVSCGGGLVCQAGMVEKLRAKGVVFSLFASPETILERTRNSSHRPLLRCEDPGERIRTLLAEREPTYREAGICVTTDGRATGEIARQIQRSYLRIVRAKLQPVPSEHPARR